MYTLGVNFEFLSIKTVLEENLTFLEEEPTELPPELIVFLDLFVFYCFSMPRYYLLSESSLSLSTTLYEPSDSS